MEQDENFIKNEYEDSLEKIGNARNSYIKKEDFINMIQNLKFDTIKEARIEFNTGYEYIPKTENEREHVKTYGFELNIDRP